MLKKILIAVAMLLIVFVAVVATRPSAYHVERKIEVAAPPDVVFAVVNDLQQFARVLVLFGSTWDALEPNMQKTFEGPPGVGQSYAWSGDEVGKGKMTIEESVPSQKVRTKLEFTEPMESTAAFALTLASTASAATNVPSNAPSGTLVTWSMDGHHNFVGKAFGLFVDMDSMLGADLEKGLAQLKTVAEAKPRPAVTP